MADTKHVSPSLGLPYAGAGVSADGQAMATYPVCGQAFFGYGHKAAGRKYAEHFALAEKAGR